MDTTMPTPIGYMVSLSESIHTSFMERMLNPMSIHPCLLRTTAMAGYSYSNGKHSHDISTMRTRESTALRRISYFLRSVSISTPYVSNADTIVNASLGSLGSLSGTRYPILWRIFACESSHFSSSVSILCSPQSNPNHGAFRNPVELIQDRTVVHRFHALLHPFR